MMQLDTVTHPRLGRALLVVAALTSACEKTSNRDDSSADDVCEAFDPLICHAACGCDECELLVGGDLWTFTDEDACLEELARPCDSVSESSFALCFEDMVEAVQMFECDATVSLPTSCEPLFGTAIDTN